MKNIILLILVSNFAFINYSASQNTVLSDENSYNQTDDFKNSQFYKEYLKHNDSIVFVNLWATSCGPCIAEIPLLNKVKSQYSQWPIEFLSISMEKDLNKIDNFLERKTFYFKDISRESAGYRPQIHNFLNQRPLDATDFKYLVPMTYIIKNKKVIKTIEGNLHHTDIFEVMDKIILE